MDFTSIDWWYWTVTLFFIGMALFGWVGGYYLVMVISLVQVVHFRIKFGFFLAFDAQVRILYFAFTLLGLIQSIRFPFYLILFFGTLMVVLFNRCGIALFLKKMPWNKTHAVKIQS